MMQELTDSEKQSFVFGIHEEDPDYQSWNKETAISIAKQQGLELTPAHWEMIDYLRKHYKDFGPTKHARTLTQVLDVKFAAKGGLKYLYTLFPNGPVNQGCKIAGIPSPRNSTEPSFGSST